MRQKIENWRQESIEKLEKDEAEHTATQYRAIVGCLKFDETDQDKIFESIASVATDNPGTCTWVLKQPKIQSWMRCTRDSTFLLLTGYPGSGKSVLSTQIATFIKSSGESLVITHFCTYLYETSCDYDHILRSILIQLIQSNTDLIAYVYHRLVLTKRTSSSRTIEELIRELMRAGSPVPSQARCIHLIIDGLEECKQDKQESVMTMLEKIVAAAESSESTICKVLVSGRTFQAGIKRSRNKHIVSLSDEKQNLDGAMACYSSSRLAILRPKMLEMSVTDTDIKGLEESIVARADGRSEILYALYIWLTQSLTGMFLWARLVLDYLTSNMLYT